MNRYRKARMRGRARHRVPTTNRQTSTRLSVVEQLRLALLSDIRTVADTLGSISDEIDTELSNGRALNLESIQTRFFGVAITLPARTRLHERLGWPGEPVSAALMLSLDYEERVLALEILFSYRARVTDGVGDEDRDSESSELLKEFFHLCQISGQRIAHGEA
jgi:hypothetical protein